MTVHLVGAGPGSADLLTLKAARLIKAADVIIHDRLIGGDVLALASPWAEIVYVGKNPNGPRVDQEEIHRILIDRGSRFNTVVRLKGGDPFVFGRGGEEALALVEAGVDVELTPGISSSIAAPALAGIPVTHRGASSSFTVVTGHEQADKVRSIDWSALARLDTTLVILMGARRATQIQEQLLLAGLAADTPVAVVSNAATAQQNTVRCHLVDLGRRPIDNPAVIVVGPTAATDVMASPDSVSPVTDLLPEKRQEERIHV